MFRHIGHKTRTDHVTFHIAQPVDALPRAPFLQRLSQIANTLSNSILSLFLVHQSKTLDGNLAGLRQVAIDLNQRVERCDIVIGLDTCQTGSTTITHLRVVVVHPLPGI